MSSTLTPLTTERCLTGEDLDSIEVEPWQVEEIPGLTIVGTTIAKTGKTTLEVFYDQRKLKWNPTNQQTHMFSTAPCETLKEGESATEIRKVQKTDLAPHVEVFTKLFIPHIRGMMTRENTVAIDAGTEAALTKLTNTAADRIPHHFYSHMCTSALEGGDATVGMLQKGDKAGGSGATKDDKTGEWGWEQRAMAAPVGTLPFTEISKMRFKRDSGPVW